MTARSGQGRIDYNDFPVNDGINDPAAFQLDLGIKPSAAIVDMPRFNKIGFTVHFP